LSLEKLFGRQEVPVAVTLFRTSLSPEALAEVQSEQKRVFFALGHLLNEVAAFQKLVLWSSDCSSEKKARLAGQVTYTMMFLRLTAGKLWEGWRLLERCYFGSKLSLSYDQELSPKGLDALSQLKRYFGRSNLVKHVRNGYAFHYSPERLEKVSGSVSDSLDVFIDNGPRTNSLYYFAEVLANHSMLSDYFEEVDARAFREFVREIPAVAGWFLDFGEAYMVAFIQRHQPGIWAEPAEEADPDKLLPFWNVVLPWFTDNEDLEKGRQNQAAPADSHSRPRGS
jgi:hypothetical protein